ncbi:hypothetical protein [Vulcaniibacterium gelatinicum]|uniref:hypothetical protein n=1 Tax=Vulcaniibacterium gelatinicum TaxID=2598725 RepID=UPI0011CC8B8F|nr:hypothetical protein [Vulcaniibacterium gelatinicum]
MRELNITEIEVVDGGMVYDMGRAAGFAFGSAVSAIGSAIGSALADATNYCKQQAYANATLAI